MTSLTKSGDAKATARVFSDYLAAQRGRVPSLPHVAILTDRVARILGGTPEICNYKGRIRTSWGFPFWIQNLIQFLQSNNLEIAYVLLTHWHRDHTGGIADLIAYRPELASRIYKNQPDRGQLPIADMETFHVEGATIQAVFTPGHAIDHMCFLLNEEQALFTGDNVLGHGFSVVEDLGPYMASLHYMGDQKSSVGYPGHGPKIDDLPSTIKRYIRREEMRVNQVQSVLVKQCLSTRGLNQRRMSITTREIVTFLHGEVSDCLFEMALEPCVNLCLWKLVEDGKVGFELVGSNRLWYTRI